MTQPKRTTVNDLFNILDGTVDAVDIQKGFNTAKNEIPQDKMEIVIFAESYYLGNDATSHTRLLKYIENAYEGIESKISKGVLTQGEWDNMPISEKRDILWADIKNNKGMDYDEKKQNYFNTLNEIVHQGMSIDDIRNVRKELSNQHNLFSRIEETVQIISNANEAQYTRNFQQWYENDYSLRKGVELIDMSKLAFKDITRGDYDAQKLDWRVSDRDEARKYQDLEDQYAKEIGKDGAYRNAIIASREFNDGIFRVLSGENREAFINRFTNLLDEMVPFEEFDVDIQKTINETFLGRVRDDFKSHEYYRERNENISTNNRHRVEYVNSKNEQMVKKHKKGSEVAIEDIGSGGVLNLTDEIDFYSGDSFIDTYINMLDTYYTNNKSLHSKFADENIFTNSNFTNQGMLIKKRLESTGEYSVTVLGIYGQSSLDQAGFNMSNQLVGKDVQVAVLGHHGSAYGGVEYGKDTPSYGFKESEDFKNLVLSKDEKDVTQDDIEKAYTSFVEKDGGTLGTDLYGWNAAMYDFAKNCNITDVFLGACGSGSDLDELSAISTVFGSANAWGQNNRWGTEFLKSNPTTLTEAMFMLENGEFMGNINPGGFYNIENTQESIQNVLDTDIKRKEGNILTDKLSEYKYGFVPEIVAGPEVPLNPEEKPVVGPTIDALDMELKYEDVKTKFDIPMIQEYDELEDDPSLAQDNTLDGLMKLFGQGNV